MRWAVSRYSINMCTEVLGKNLLDHPPHLIKGAKERDLRIVDTNSFVLRGLSKKFTGKQEQ